MMRVRRVDRTGDMVFGSGQAAFHRDTPDAVAQVVTSRLHLWAGEWYLDPDEGTPYQTNVLGKYTRATRDPVMQARILSAPGVTELVAYSSAFDPQSRTFTLSARIGTAFASPFSTSRLSSAASVNASVYEAR